MNLGHFQAARNAEWQELDQLLAKAKRDPRRLGSAGVRRMGQLYRSLSADVALARNHFPGDPLTGRLESLLRRTYPMVYRSKSETGRGFVHFWSRGYWREVRRRPLILLAAFVLLWGSAGGGLLWALADRDGARSYLPAQIDEALDGGPPSHADITADEKAGFSAQIFTNNIRVGFLTFAGGFTMGLLTIYVLFMNGLLAGTLLGVAIELGNGPETWALLAPHGLLELSLIAVTGAAGLRLAYAVMVPGRMDRLRSLQLEASATVTLIVGSSALLVFAGAVEGFITPAGYGVMVNTMVGLVLGLGYWYCVLVRGGPEPSPEDRP